MEEVIRNEINKLVISYLKEGLFELLPHEKIKPNASHINNGYCRLFAYDLSQNLNKYNIESVYHEVNYKEYATCFFRNMWKVL
jgi:hypothetical protein